MLEPLLLGVALPGAIALLVALMLRRLWQANGPWPAAWSTALAAALGLIGGAFALSGSISVPPSTVEAWPPWWGLLAVPLAFLPGHRGARLTGILLAGVGVGLTLTLPLVPHALSGGEAAGITALVAISIGVGATLLHATLTASGDTFDGRAGLLVQNVWAGGGAAIVMLSATVVGAQLLGAFAAASGALVVLALWRPGSATSDTSGAGASLIPLTALLVPGVAWMAHLYADMNTVTLVLLLAAPLLLPVGAMLQTARRGTLARIVLPAAVFSVLIGAAAGLQAMDYFADPAAAEDASTDGDAPEDDNSYGYE
ncbi:MAG: hypothetical protein ACI9MR_004516 [Myxococcota bacterium]|jgi:hypothetical protein